MADPAADLDSSFARLKLSLGGSDSDFEDALAAFGEKARLAYELGALHVEPPPDMLSVLPDDLLVRLLGTAQWEAIAALECVAKRYADVCERAGWACAARRFGRCTNAPFGGGDVHWTALAWDPFECEATWCRLNPFDEDAFDARGAPPPDDLADAFFWAEFSTARPVPVPTMNAWRCGRFPTTGASCAIPMASSTIARSGPSLFSRAP